MFFSIVFGEFFDSVFYKILKQATIREFLKTKIKLSDVFEMIFLLLFRGDNCLNLLIFRFFCFHNFDNNILFQNKSRTSQQNMGKFAK
jgi:hypothetical protein